MNIEEIYYQKYLKYKTKYLELQNEFVIIPDNNLIGGAKEKFACDPTKEFNMICKKDNSGIYKSKQSCQNDCETKYIKRNLIEAKLINETKQFNFFIQDLMAENISIYIKGGTVLGLKVLKMLYDRYHSNNFEKKFNEFRKLDLIRDWDFACYTEEKEITPDYREDLDKMARNYRLVPRAKTFILYQSKYPIKINDQALFEIAILQSDNYLDQELPLTTMKVRVNRRNLYQIFMLAKSFYSSDPIDINVIKHIIKDMRIIVPEASGGLYVTKKLDKGELSPQLINFIIKFSKGNVNLQQFLATHIKEPNRLLYRLIEKNIPKMNKIERFLKENNLMKGNLPWLADTNFLMSEVDFFVEELGSKLTDLIVKSIEQKKNLREIITVLDEFLSGVNLDRIKLHYDDYTAKGLELLRIWFGPIYNEIFIDNEKVFNIKDSNLVKIMVFMINRKLFDK